jgi:hypothetical protein
VHAAVANAQTIRDRTPRDACLAEPEADLRRLTTLAIDNRPGLERLHDIHRLETLRIFGWPGTPSWAPNRTSTRSAWRDNGRSPR